MDNSRQRAIKSTRLLGAILLAASLCAQDTASVPPKDLTQASLEDLMKVQVTSVSKKEQKLWTAGAAVFVLTQEDIRRSGYTNVPDLLRMVPGVNVARMNASTWAISVRGFNDLYANRVLVLVDGRSVFDPLFSGVHWGDLDIPLEDIERIEVIRGPGGTVWGANAVDGVINIITKSSESTQGALLRTGMGTTSAGDSLAQYGGQIGTFGTYRVFEKYFDVDNFRTPVTVEPQDGWHSFHEGFRADLKAGPSDTLMIEGDFMQNEQGELIHAVLANSLPAQATINDINRDANGSFLAVWNHDLKSGDQLSFQIYGDYLDRHVTGAHFFERTVGFDFQDHMSVGSRQDVVWGAGMRVDSLITQAGYSISFEAPTRSDFFENVFLQDQIRLTDSLSLTAGAKFEHNDYTGFEYEASSQLVWTPSPRHTFWASAARTIRQPSMVDTQIHLDLAVLPSSAFPFTLMTLQGNPNPRTEVGLNYEMGYRVQAGSRLTLDIAGFSTLFRDARIGDSLTPYPVFTPSLSYLVLPFTFAYEKRDQTYGGEAFANWDVTSKWRLSPSYSLFREMLTRPDSSDIVLTAAQSGLSSPRSRFELRSMLTLPHNFEWDTNFAYTSAIMGGAIPAYTQLDSRIGWHGRNFELSLNGQNLFRPYHLEFPSETGVANSFVPRSVFAQIAWRSRPPGR